MRRALLLALIASGCSKPPQEQPATPASVTTGSSPSAATGSAAASAATATAAAAPPSSTAPAAADAATAMPAGDPELELPDMGVAIRVPADWKPDLTRDRSRPNDPRQSQLVSGPKQKFISIYRPWASLKTVEDIEKKVRRDTSDTIANVRAKTLPSGQLYIAYERIPSRGSSYVELHVVIPGDEPLACKGTDLGGDFELIERICSSLRRL